MKASLHDGFIWQADGTQPVREVDFLVVGAGIVGCAAAYFAAQAGHEVVITEMRDLALGASSRNAGFMITGLDIYYHRAIERYGRTKVRELWALSQRTHQFWRDIAAWGSVRLDQCGSMLLAESPAEAKELEQTARLMTADGHAVIFHETDPLGRGYFAGIEQPNDCAVHPYELAAATLSASEAELIAGNEVYGIEQTDPEVVTVYTRQYAFKARHVLLCTNAYASHLHPYFVGKVIPTRAQVSPPRRSRMVRCSTAAATATMDICTTGRRSMGGC